LGAADEIRAALAANAAFYAAFAAGDAEAMEGLWATTSPVICVHPGTTALHGRDAVMQSWQEILASPPPIRHDSAQVAVVRGLAIVTCLEHIDDDALCATNVFLWEDGAWRLAHHQASGIHPSNLDVTSSGGHLH
jgi:ketosteroid isomerase-like protein